MKFDLVSICSTTVCNAKCALCTRSLLKEIKKIHLDFNLISPFLNRINYLSLNGTFGDVIHHPQLIDFLKECDSQPFLTIEIATNGDAKNDSFWVELGKIKKLHVIFGIDGLEDTHYRYRHTNFNRVLHNMEVYIKNGGYAIWQFIDFDYNHHQINECSELSKKIGCKEFKTIRSNIYNSEFKRPSSEIYSRNELVNKKSIEYCYWKFREGKPFNSIYIDILGYVHPCCHVVSYPFLLFLIGKSEIRSYGIYDELRPLFIKNKNKLNLKNNNIDDILNNEYFKYIYDNFRNLKICKEKCGLISKGKDENEIKTLKRTIF